MPTTLFLEISTEIGEKLRNVAFLEKRARPDVVRDAIEYYLIPPVVKETIAHALTISAAVEFWKTPHKLLDNKSPEQLWNENQKGKVFALIKAAKSGDMA